MKDTVRLFQFGVTAQRAGRAASAVRLCVVGVALSLGLVGSSLAARAASAALRRADNASASRRPIFLSLSCMSFLQK